VNFPRITPEEAPDMNPLELAELNFVVGNIIDHVERARAAAAQDEQTKEAA
jgi:hypothetical protein